MKNSFWSKIKIAENGCWIYCGSLDPRGYGRLTVGSKSRGAHVFSYESQFGKVPKGLELDHLCRVPACVNPLHLEPVTHRINILRGNTVPAKHAKKTHCPFGHPYSGENLMIEKNGQRRCRICKKYTDRKSDAKMQNKPFNDILPAPLDSGLCLARAVRGLVSESAALASFL